MSGQIIVCITIIVGILLGFFAQAAVGVIQEPALDSGAQQGILGDIEGLKRRIYQVSDDVCIIFGIKAVDAGGIPGIAGMGGNAGFPNAVIMIGSLALDISQGQRFKLQVVNLEGVIQQKLPPAGPSWS